MGGERTLLALGEADEGEGEQQLHRKMVKFVDGTPGRQTLP
eukprot:COSAG01_NODE_62750_length_283_cov_0.695652_1_plen_40_part_01